MKYLLSVLFVVSTFCLTAAIPFTDAVRDGKVKVTIEGKGGHFGRVVAVHFEKLTKESLSITIPAGHVFEPQDSTTQPIIVLKEETFTLDKPKQFIRVQGACAQSGKHSPFEKETFRIGALSQGNLLKMAQYIASNKLWNQTDAQYAIWVFTDNIDVANITHPGLLSTACALLSIPKPEYKVVASKPAPSTSTQQRRVQVVQPEPFAYKGEFVYHSNNEVEISVVVYNEAGEVVRTIFEPMKHKPGQGTYSFFFQTTKLPKGKYKICFLVDQKVHKTINVRY